MKSISFTLLLLFVLLYTIGLGVLKGFQDKGMFKYGKLNPFKTWLNKYKHQKLTKNHWWYFRLYTPTYDEKFPFSTTLLVSFTDLWHLLEFVRNILPFIIFSIFFKWYCIFYYFLFFTTFHIIFTLKPKKNYEKS